MAPSLRESYTGHVSSSKTGLSDSWFREVSFNLVRCGGPHIPSYLWAGKIPEHIPTSIPHQQTGSPKVLLLNFTLHVLIS